MNQRQYDRLHYTIDLQLRTLLAYFGNNRRGAKAAVHKRLKEARGMTSLVEMLKLSLREISAGEPLSNDNINRLVNVYCGMLGELRDERLKRKYREPYEPVRHRLLYTLNKARQALGEALGNDYTLILQIPGLPGLEVDGAPGTCAISPLWHRQMDAVGGPSIGHRFIARATLVDQIGEYDLFEVTYFENGAKKNTPQTGYVGRFRDTTIRGFGVKPDTALSWTRRQVVMRGTKALTK